MTDIVERLRDPNRLAATKRDEEAADEIERLRTEMRKALEAGTEQMYKLSAALEENKRLRLALRAIAGMNAVHTARKALGDE